MTRKFKKAVRGVVADGKITDEEKKAIFDLAKEENLSSHDVQIFLSTELKKSQKKNEKQNDKRENRRINGTWWDHEIIKKPAVEAIVYAIKNGAPHAIKTGQKALPFIKKLVTKR